MPCSLGELMAIYDDRPPLLQKALLRAYVLPQIAALTKETRGVFLSLVARVALYKPLSTFLARADRCAAEVGVSRRTVTRATNRLIDLGLLLEDGGGRAPSGRFGAFGYRLPKDVATILGLVEDAANHQETKLSHGSLYINFQLKEDQPSQDSKQETASPPKSATKQPNPLPEDLVSLQQEFAVHPYQVYRLMGLATRAGYRLSDLLLVAKDYLKAAGAAGVRVVRYLEAMIRKGGRYEQRVDKKRKADKDEAALQALRIDRSTYDNKVFYSQRGSRVEVRSGIALVTTPEGQSYAISGQGMLTVYEDIKRGVLSPAENRSKRGEPVSACYGRGSDKVACTHKPLLANSNLGTRAPRCVQHKPDDQGSRNSLRKFAAAITQGPAPIATYLGQAGL